MRVVRGSALVDIRRPRDVVAVGVEELVRRAARTDRAHLDRAPLLAVDEDGLAGDEVAGAEQALQQLGALAGIAGRAVVTLSYHCSGPHWEPRPGLARLTPAGRMEAADWLYGVSMGQDGVSKVLSRRSASVSGSRSAKCFSPLPPARVANVIGER